MVGRLSVRAVLLAAALPILAVSFSGCGKSTTIDSVTISPSSVSVGTGSTAQLTAIGTVGHGSHPSSSQNITTTVTWSSSATSVATVSSAGIVTGVGAGTASITASIEGYGGLITSNEATVTVTGSGGGGTNGNLASLAIIPNAQSVASPGQTSQFIAIGTTSGGATENLTSQVAWSSSSSSIATITNVGVATGVSQGTATITAIYTNADKTVVTGTATFTVVGGTTEQVTALAVYPTVQAATSQAQTTQFFVLGTEGGGLQFDVTGQVAWTSSDTAVVTVGTAGNGTPGLATAVGDGTATITATYTNKDSSKVVGTASYSVTIGAAQEPLLSINIVPGNGITVSNKGMTGQFLAFGTYSSTPTVRDLTNKVQWISLLPEVVSVDSGGVAGEIGGLATAQGYTGTGVVYAEATNPDGTVVLSNPANFSCEDPDLAGACNQEIAHPQFATITVYNAGENNTTWLVTAPSDTGTPNLIHCGPGSKSGGSVCTGTYETGSTVTLTASPLGTGFGGWSSGDGEQPGIGCIPKTGYTLLNSPTCTVTITGNTSVGAIFY